MADPLHVGLFALDCYCSDIILQQISYCNKAELFRSNSLIRGVIRIFTGLDTVFCMFALQFFFVLFFLFQFFLPLYKIKIRFCHRVTSF